VCKRQALANLAIRVSNFYESKAEVRSFVERLQQRPTEMPEVADVFKLRANIASRLRTLVESLVVAPLGDRPKVEKTIDFLRGQAGATDVIAHMEARLASGTDDLPYFAVGFRNGTIRTVYPSEPDPLNYRQQVVGNNDGIRLLSIEIDPEELEFLNMQMQAYDRHASPEV
jgi:hypothetical protein